MRILVIASKAPWPPVDGGRLILLTTIDALSALGHEVTLVAPVETGAAAREAAGHLGKRCSPHLVESRVRGLVRSVVGAQIRRQPVTIVRHEHEAVRRKATKLLQQGEFEVVHVEQQQALYAAVGAADARCPVVLRAHNIESALWEFAAEHRPTHLRWWFERQKMRLERWEAASLRQVDHTIALTKGDAAGLGALSGSSESISIVEAPFSVELPASPRRLPGNPSVVILASGGWQPNRDAVWRFAAEVWPSTLRTLPDAALHVFGVPSSGIEYPGIEWHAPPDESIDAFPEGSIVAIPARHPTGVPMKCLEAWARGLPIVGSSLAAGQLGTGDGEAMLVADTADDFAHGFQRLFDEPGLRHRLITNGRAMLRTRHDPARVARRLVEVYSSDHR